jgi:hypothetical protein
MKANGTTGSETFFFQRSEQPDIISPGPLMKTEFTLHDFVAMEEQVRPPTFLAKALMRLTGHSQTLKLLEISDPDLEQHKAQVRAIYQAMTPEQQAAPDALDSSARHEIATRAGLSILEVTRFLNRFNLTRAALERVTQSTTPPSPTSVLGLVTHDPHHRDPSFLLKPVPRRDLLLWLFIPLALAAASSSINGSSPPFTADASMNGSHPATVVYNPPPTCPSHGPI